MDRKEQILESNQLQLVEIKKYIGGSVSEAPERGGFLVESELEDGEFVPGGQSVRMIVRKKEHHLISGSPGDAETDLGEVYEVASLVVNGQELFEKPVRVFLFTEKTEKPEFAASHSGKYILFNAFSSADHLVAFLHEKGHTSKKRGEPAQDYLLKKRAVIATVNSLIMFSRSFNFDFTQPAIIDGFRKQIPVESLRSLLTEEHRASQVALDEIRERRGKYGDLFPGDLSLAKVKLFYANQISSYMGSGFHITWGKVLGDRAKEFMQFE